MTRIAFLGLGNMGGLMAANLVKAGREVCGYDLAPPLCTAAAQSGVHVAASAGAAAHGADVVVSMLADGKDVLSLWTELLPQAVQGVLFIDCSTIDIATAREVHRKAQDACALSVDAPVSGGVAGARAGTLSFMCGGDSAAIDKARPILADMGKTIIPCGGAGLGQAAKICNNMMLAATMIVTCEAFTLAEKLGLTPQALFDVASVSSGQSWSLTSYCPVRGLTLASPANDGYKPGFMASLMLKDLKLAQEEATSAGAPTPLGALALQLYALYVASGQGASDFSGIIRMIQGASKPAA
jgi:3-hydroxyisobutyrate dehydrogenase